MGQGVLDDGEAGKEGGARGKPSLYHDQGTWVIVSWQPLENSFWYTSFDVQLRYPLHEARIKSDWTPIISIFNIIEWERSNGMLRSSTFFIIAVETIMINRIDKLLSSERVSIDRNTLLQILLLQE